MNQYDPLYNLREEDPAHHIAVEGDLMNVWLVADEDEPVEVIAELVAVPA